MLILAEEDVMESFRSLATIAPFRAADGAQVQELAGLGIGLSSHSLAVITHPAGTTSVEHHHTLADEVYFVWRGRGRVRVDGVERNLAAGDVLIIRPGERHKLWNDGPDDLALIVTCAPAYDPAEVRWDEV
jgi:mannose-6-phosphate isomerase-like protein (cupin superfamily)